MKFAIVSRHVPDAEGTAAGRILIATCDGLLRDGHQVRAWSWGTEPPEKPLPDWCEWHPVSAPRGVARIRSYVEPVTEVRQIGWVPPDDPEVIAVADDPPSWPAVASTRHAVVTIHYLTKLDVRAIRRRSVHAWQLERAERRAARSAPLVLAYSERVARAAGPRAVPVPVAYPVPAEPVPPIEDPIAAVVADWRWPPNRTALASLLKAWPEVRDRVPTARLLVGGRGLDGLDASEGVEPVGAPARSVDVLSRAAIVAFPSPDTSGPKIKVLEALALGLPVATTPAGVEGLRLPTGGGVIVTEPSGFATAVASLLSDPAERARLGRAGREAVLAAHAPLPAARARVAACRRGIPGIAV